jgi:hypothetical protein
VKFKVEILTVTAEEKSKVPKRENAEFFSPHEKHEKHEISEKSGTHQESELTKMN